MTQPLRFWLLGFALGLPLTQRGAEQTSVSPPIQLPGVTVSAFAPLRKVADFHLLHGRASCAVVAYGDCLYIIGGQASGGELSDSVEEFNIRTGQSREFARLATARFRHRAVLVGQKIYVVGGESLSRVLSAINAPRSAMDALPEQRLLDSSDDLPNIELDDSVEIIDLVTGKVTAGPSMRDARSNFGCAAIGEKIYVIGGKHLKGYIRARTNRTEILDLSSNRWVEGVPMPTPRETNAVVVTGPFIVLAGGFNSQRAVSVVEAFNPRTRMWASVTPLDQSISSTAAVFSGHFLFLFGDYDRPDEVMAYDLTTKASVALSLPYRSARDAAAVAYHDRIWVVGGKTLPDSDPTNLVQVFELTKPQEVTPSEPLPARASPR